LINFSIQSNRYSKYFWHTCEYWLSPTRASLWDVY